MTKKHYEAIASIIKINRKNLEYIVQKGYTNAQALESNFSLINMLAEYLAKDNPKFQRDRFLTACGIEARQDWYCRSHRTLEYPCDKCTQ